LYFDSETSSTGAVEDPLASDVRLPEVDVGPLGEIEGEDAVFCCATGETVENLNKSVNFIGILGLLFMCAGHSGSEKVNGVNV
jgi:hypothetical protein